MTHALPVAGEGVGAFDRRRALETTPLDALRDAGFEMRAAERPALRAQGSNSWLTLVTSAGDSCPEAWRRRRKPTSTS